MLKVISPFEYPGEANISTLFSTGLEKKAAYGEIEEFCSTLTPKEGYTYLHILAMGSAEYWGHNRNCDSFPEENLIKYHKTFETTPAMLYRNHINKDPSRSYGKVIFACYNMGMHRVELICECQNELVEDINQEIRLGKFPATSMATKTPSDRCSICGNRARTRQEYCTHLQNELGRLYPDGRRVVAINDDALIFFDISKVVRPADVTSSVLVKVAQEVVTSSAELAEIDGLFDKTAELKKMSEFIKEIEGTVVSSSAVEDKILEHTKDLPTGLIPGLAQFSLTDILHALVESKISPSIKFLSELLAHKQLGEGYEGIGSLVEEYLPSLGQDVSLPDFSKKLEPGTDNKGFLVAMLRPYLHDSSLDSGMVEKRASNIGYSGNGPKIEEHPTTPFAEGPFYESPSLAKILVTLGVGSLLAKHYITSEIAKQLNAKKSLTNSDNGVKIIFIKSANDAKVSVHLAKRSLLKSAQLFRYTPVVANGNPHEDNQGGFGSSSQGFLTRAVRRVLKSSNNEVGQKLSTLLKTVSVGSKII